MSSATAQNEPISGPTIPPPTIQEFSVRIPKRSRRRMNLMHFNAAQKVVFGQWRRARLQREDNQRTSTYGSADMPKFGAGSIYGREAREEARRLKRGIRLQQYRPEAQPWILKAQTDLAENAKLFRGIKEGGVGTSSAYYIFAHALDGSIEAYPLHEWYKFQPVQRYKALSAEEAEAEFNRRGNVVNYFSVMVRKRLRNENDDDVDSREELPTTSRKPKASQLKISEMDDWMDSDDEDDDEDGSDQEDKKKKSQSSDKKKENLKKKDKKKKKHPSDDEAFEESDDGDEEGRECDYISDSSASEAELEQQKEIKSVAEESGLKNLLASDEDDEDDEQEDNKENAEQRKTNIHENKDKHKDKDTEKDKDKTKDKLKDTEKDKESEKNKNKDKDKYKFKDTDKDNNKENLKNGEKEKRTEGKCVNAISGSNSTSDADSSTDQDKEESRKRPQSGDTPDVVQAKRPRIDTAVTSSASTVFIPGASESGITVDAISRYLMRKPMTMIDLLKKFKSKKTGLTKEEVGHILMLVLKKINPSKQKVNGVMYYSIPK